MLRYHKTKSYAKAFRMSSRKEKLLKDSKEGTEKYAEDRASKESVEKPAKDKAGGLVNIAAISPKAF